MRTSRACTVIGLCALLGAGCASTVDNLQRATAQTIGNNTSPESVAISNVDRGVTNVKWDATAPSGRYACSADDMVRRPYCVKK